MAQQDPRVHPLKKKKTIFTFQDDVTSLDVSHSNNQSNANFGLCSGWLSQGSETRIPKSSLVNNKRGKQNVENGNREIVRGKYII